MVLQNPPTSVTPTFHNHKPRLSLRPRPLTQAPPIPPVSPEMPGHTLYVVPAHLETPALYLLAANFWQINPPGIWVTM